MKWGAFFAILIGDEGQKGKFRPLISKSRSRTLTFFNFISKISGQAFGAIGCYFAVICTHLRVILRYDGLQLWAICELASILATICCTLLRRIARLRG